MCLGIDNTMYFNFTSGQALRPVVVQSKCDWLWVPSPLYLNLNFHFFTLMLRPSAALSSATQHAKALDFGGKWETECLNTRISLPTMLCAGYSGKLIYLFYFSSRNTLLKIMLILWLSCGIKYCHMYFKGHFMYREWNDYLTFIT